MVPETCLHINEDYQLPMEQGRLPSQFSRQLSLLTTGAPYSWEAGKLHSHCIQAGGPGPLGNFAEDPVLFPTLPFLQPLLWDVYALPL